MNEQQWLTCDDPMAMLGQVRYRPTFDDHVSVCVAAAVANYNIGTPIERKPHEACDHIREIVGNPFRAAALCGNQSWRIRDGLTFCVCDVCQSILAWKDRTVTSIAKEIAADKSHKSHNSDAMLILADALEEAGCRCESILEHLRKGRDGEVCAWCDGRGAWVPAPFSIQEGSPTMRNGIIMTECYRCNGTGLRKTPHLDGCWVLSLLPR